MLCPSLKIKERLKLNNAIVVFDQALYAKAMDFKWRYSECFGDIILRVGAFHTFCTLLGVINKRFQDAGLRDLCAESQVIAEVSVSGVLEGTRYNRAVRLHRLVFETMMRQAWLGFRTWIAEKLGEKTRLVSKMFESLQSLRDNVCEAEFQKLHETFFFEVTELFGRYTLFVRHENGHLSEF